MDHLKIVFLDVDGVLLPGRAWTLPENIAVTEAHRADPRHSVGELALQTRFDPVAVALVNRLCERTEALVVAETNWRRNVGMDETRGKLVEQGLEERYLHPRWACPWSPRSDKGRDIALWLQDNCPPQDKQEDSIDYVVLDDEPVYGFEQSQVVIRGNDGFCTDAYRVACAALGGADPQMGVVPVDPGILVETVNAWNGDRIAALRFLHEGNGYTWTRARRIRPVDNWDRDLEIMLGRQPDPNENARRLVAYRKELRQATRHLRRRGRRAKPPDNDF